MDETKKSIELKVKLPSAEELTIRVKPTTAFKKVFDAVAERMQVDPNSLRFQIDNERIAPTQCPKMFEMDEDGEFPQILCLTQAHGGGGGGGAGDGDGIVNLHVVVPGQDKLTIKVKGKTMLSKVFDAVAAQTGRTKSDFRFFHDGAKLKENKSVMESGLTDGDEIEAMVEQVGGGAGDVLGDGDNAPAAVVELHVRIPGDSEPLKIKVKKTAPFSKVRASLATRVHRTNTQFHKLCTDLHSTPSG